jgi:hypothetical protein
MEDYNNEPHLQNKFSLKMQRSPSVFINQILIIKAHLVTNATCHDPKIKFSKIPNRFLSHEILTPHPCKA